MSNWKDLGRPLTPNEVRRLVRDACAMIGKCNSDDAPATVLGQTLEELNFDNPPLRSRPSPQTRLQPIDPDKASRFGRKGGEMG